MTQDAFDGIDISRKMAFVCLPFDFLHTSNYSCVYHILFFTQDSILQPETVFFYCTFLV